MTWPPMETSNNGIPAPTSDDPQLITHPPSQSIDVFPRKDLTGLNGKTDPYKDHRLKGQIPGAMEWFVI